MELLLVLIACHFLADYTFQSDAVATGKNRHLDPAKFGVNWWYWLTSHAVTHGVLVGIFTGSVWIALAEVVAHWLIDFGKCEKWYGLHVDQVLHFLCKVAWVLILL